MKQVPDRKRLRRIKHGGSIEQSSLGNVVGRWVVTMAVCLCVWCVMAPICHEAFFGGDAWFGIVILVPLLLVSVSSTGKVVRRAREQYFPPVTPNTLPAVEVLVRSSEEPPVVQSEVLLRAAQAAQETPKEELLRIAEE